MTDGQRTTGDQVIVFIRDVLGEHVDLWQKWLIRQAFDRPLPENDADTPARSDS